MIVTLLKQIIALNLSATIIGVCFLINNYDLGILVATLFNIGSLFCSSLAVWFWNEIEKIINDESDSINNDKN